ncbi:DUF7670 domain-containing protein [Maribellus mangrovi]|uniref:DUF7670 domain-containing protein n=1 Tax=Maribellus mangrovi TaxID=3133146 RepID=UPI0030ECD6EC
MKIYRLIVRILGLLALIGYVLFLIDEGIPLLTSQATFADISAYILFAVFLAAFILLWKHELLSGILMIVWFGLVLFCIFNVWEDAALAGILALPIAIIGIVVFIFGILKKRAVSTTSI